MAVVVANWTFRRGVSNLLGIIKDLNKKSSYTILLLLEELQTRARLEVMGCSDNGRVNVQALKGWGWRHQPLVDIRLGSTLLNCRSGRIHRVPLPQCALGNYGRGSSDHAYSLVKLVRLCHLY